jgi:hypothetical protein
MIVVSLYGGCGLLEADVVETSEGSTTDVFNGVIRDQELLLWRRIQQLVHHYNNSIFTGNVAKPHIHDSAFPW